FEGKSPALKLPGLYPRGKLMQTSGRMSDDQDPPRKFYQLKPREFEVVNTPASTPPDGNLPTNVRAHFLAAKGEMPKRPAPLPVQRNDVHAILSENLARDNAAGLNELAPKPKRPSRRNRDFWLLAIPLNGFFAFAAFGPYRNPVTFVYGIAGMAITTVSLI